MPRGGARPNSGRKFGSQNRATIQRELLAAQQMAKARGEKRETALDVMARIAKLCEGAAAVCRPVPAAEIAAGKAPNPDGDWGRFHDWVTLWGASVRELAKYQHPPMKPVDAPAPPPDPDAQNDQPRRRFALRVFEGGRALPAPDDAA